MPVDDHPIHPRVKHDKVIAGCNSLPRAQGGFWVQDGWIHQGLHGLGGSFPRWVYHHNTMSEKCRQIGVKRGSWVELDECEGCTAEKDLEYINKARNDIDREFQK